MTIVETVINKPGGIAKVTAVEELPDGARRYRLESETGQASFLDLSAPVTDVVVGDVFDWEGEDFLSPARISFGGEVLFEAPPATNAQFVLARAARRSGD